MNKPLMLIALLLCCPMVSQAEAQDCPAWLDHEIRQLNSDTVIDLCAETAGKPLLLVNTASYCGYTYQFSGLEQIHQAYRDRGLVVIGFPSDDFNQEDDDPSVTAEVCYINHGVTFLMTEVVDVKRPGTHPIFRHLRRRAEEPGWNFNKYVINREGRVVRHFSSEVEPDSAALLQTLESVL